MSREINVRLAKTEDYEGILNIDDIYAGTDYLPACYKRFLQDSNMLMYVAEKDKRIVGFSSITSTLGGRGALHCMARVHPEYRNLGISTLMKKYKIQQYLKNHPETEKIITIKEDSEYEQNKRRLPGSKPALSRARCSVCKLNAGEVESVLKEVQELAVVYGEQIKISELKKEQVELLEVQSFFSYDTFFTGQCWTPHWSSEVGILEAMEKEYAMISCKQKEYIGLSFSSILPIQLGTSVSILYYGKDANDFKVHFLNQFLTQLKSYKEGDIILYVHFPEQLKPLDIIDFLKKELHFDIHWRKDNEDYFYTVILEEEAKTE